jgi:2,4-dienoyl-CoA reductase-like NADH-dependent reductase (Old Yellow Enzyme family)
MREDMAAADRARIIREVVEKLAYRQVPGVIVSVRITNDAGLTGGWDDPESVRVVLLGALVEMIP